MKSLAVRVLSDFGVDGIEPQALGSRKARLALHLLALAGGQAVSPAVLIDALWDSAPPARPEDQLAVLMSRLRSVLGRDRIEHRDRGYLLHCDWLDAAELATLASEAESRREAGNLMGAVAAARVALSLIGGEGPQPLPGEWAQLRHAGLERLISRTRLVAATALLEAGDWMAACDAAAAALERDPYDEAALRVLLRGYVMGGQVAGALARYASARQRMADELGTDPSPETAALYTAIVRGELTVPARPSPAAAIGLVGRDDELACLETIAARARGGPAGAHGGSAGDRGGSAEVIVIDGEAGIGKTTLLRAWADRRAAAGDTVLLAPCGPLDRSLPLDALLTALAGLLRGLGPEVTADLLGTDAALLAPLLGVAPGPRPPPMLADSVLGPAVLYAALVRVLGRLTERAPLVLAVDDAHLAGPALADWLRFLRREQVAVAVVAAVRPGEGTALPATALVHLGALDRDAAAELVGPGRVDELYARSKGHPLFLTELAQQAAGAELPASLVESVSARCDELGAAGLLLRTAAVIGPEPDGWLARARVRTLRRRYGEALADVERAAAAGPAVPAALEAGAWASYFGRDFRQAAQFAEDGALAAADAATRARCLAAGGRTYHAAGDLARAELLLGEAFSLAEGADRVTAAGWLGVLRAHQSRVTEALALLRPAARGQVGVEHTSATLHSLLFTGHAHALAGRPAQALAAFDRYTAEVERRQVPRFAGRAVNFAGWVLRNLGAWPEALDHHHEALEAGQRLGTAEVVIAALEDLAEQFLETGDPDGAQSRLAQAAALLRGDLVFGWRLQLKHQLITGRLALMRGQPERALAEASELESRAAALGVPRYTSAARLARGAGRYADGLRREADKRLSSWPVPGPA